MRFGRLADTSQRAWCRAEIERLGIAYFDAPILVWSRTIDYRRRRIYFGHWDWIVGVLSMLQVCFLMFMTLAICLCPCVATEDKVLYGMAYAMLTVYVFQKYKGKTFDVYKIGTKYFKSQGWTLTPTLHDH